MTYNQSTVGVLMPCRLAVLEPCALLPCDRASPDSDVRPAQQIKCNDARCYQSCSVTMGDEQSCAAHLMISNQATCIEQCCRKHCRHTCIRMSLSSAAAATATAVEADHRPDMPWSSHDYPWGTQGPHPIQLSAGCWCDLAVVSYKV